MPPKIKELIDKNDSVEILRDQIAAILLTEQAGQQVLATAAGKDPRLWALRIFTERSNPWDAFQNLRPGEDGKIDALDSPPIVNITFETTTFDEKASNIVARQKGVFTYNIDCYGLGIATDDPGNPGYFAGDERAGKESARAAKLVRNILMSAQYVTLDMTGLVWSRWPQSITAFMPQLEERSLEQIVGTRISFEVGANEFSPQVVGEALDLVSVTVKRAETGEIYFVAQFD